MKKEYNQKLEESRKTKLQTKIHNTIFVACTVIASCLLLIFHDILPKGVSGPFGFSSLRAAWLIIGLLLFSIIPWIGWYLVAKGKMYRFVLILPISLALYQLIVNVVNLRKTTFNDFSTQLIFIIILVAMLSAWFISKKLKGWE